ncbi:N-acetyltransferase [Nitratifractor sp.]|uniref:N-acetyltransferase n=1 Tax=Nitratifractor sp. TaxID=2268144 RepID=UPI0025DBBB78|nr:N-acetyltransferase [Nitratifractor sp.]
MIEFVRPTLRDIPAMQRLVAKEVEEGVILRRSDDEVATNIRSYHLARVDGRLAGYGALHIHSPRMAEIRSLIVAPEYRGKHLGEGLVASALEEARQLAVEEVLVLTYLPEFFRKLGFEEIAKESIPEQKIWTDCIKCIHFPNCHETSLVYRIDGSD